MLSFKNPFYNKHFGCVCQCRTKLNNYVDFAEHICCNSHEQTEDIPIYNRLIK